MLLSFHKDTHNLAGGAGALAGAMQARDCNRGERIGMVLNGANIDWMMLAGILTG